MAHLPLQIRIFLPSMLAIGFVFHFSQVSLAADGDAAKATVGIGINKATAKPEIKSDATTFTPEHEAAALMFVRTNHVELADLLTQLKGTKPKEYETAIVELFRTSERLSQTQTASSGRYALELESWKIKSQIQLLAAQATMESNDDLKTKLRDALFQQAQNRIKLLRFEREAAAERLKKLDAQIEQAEKDREPSVDKQLEWMVRSIDRMKNPPPLVGTKKETVPTKTPEKTKP